MIVEIIKISFDSKNFYNLVGTLNLENRKINFEIPLDTIEEVLNLKEEEIKYGSDTIYEKLKNVYILGSDYKYYSCLNCIFSFNINEKLKFTSVSIDVILENVLTDNDNIETKKVVFHTYYLGHSIHSVFINDFVINYSSSVNIIIKKYYDSDFNIDIIVESKKNRSYKKLSKISYTILEMIFLIFGDMPIIKDILVDNNGEPIRYNFIMADKYKSEIKKKFGKEILGCINLNTVNKDNIKKFEKFRKDTKIIYDLLLININSDGYKEIKNCNLVQIMEGLYKTLKGDNNLNDILEFYFISTAPIKKLLSRRDKRIVKDDSIIFLYKARNHRNYLSHLNLQEYKNVFFGLENIYAYWKLCIALRIYILQYIGIQFDKSCILKFRKEIDDWAKKNKLRFSLKKNHKIK